MTTNVATLMQVLSPEELADEVVNMWTDFKGARTSWEAEMVEIRNYKNATSTRTTEVSGAGFKNSTTIPKLAQIATNLQANYTAHLFSNPNWAQFEAFDKDSDSKEKRKILEAYVRTKIRRKDYEGQFNKALLSWIDTGACVAEQRYVTEKYVDTTGNEKMLYQGTVLDLIPVSDVAWDVTATSFTHARKVIRKVYTLGDIAREIQDNADSPFTAEMLEDMRNARQAVRSSGIVKAPEGVDWKGQVLSKDGFGDLLQYMNSDLVEVHIFYGDMYMLDTGEFLKNAKITILDRRIVAEKKEIQSRNGSQYLYYCGWEDRTDNLMAMSPLARLVGMQYKVDKLENMRADVFDLIANPTTVEVGDVEFHGVRGAPGGRYRVDEQGSVNYLAPDTTALNADFQLNNTLQLMELMAGSPQNSSGFRTPGEKTAFEVQFLDNGANRIFRDKTNKFEREFIEPILDDMVELGKANLGDTDLISTEGNEFNVREFLNITRDDLNVSGKLRARGSRLFAEKANALQNLMGILNSGAINLISPHVSRIGLAEAVEELADLEEFNIIIPNIGIQEDSQSQQLAQVSAGANQEADAIAASSIEEDDDEIA
jgi:hypothetical protein